MVSLSLERNRPWSALVGLALAAFAYLAAAIVVAPLGVIDPAVFDPGESAARPVTVASLVLNFVGFVVAGAAYLAYTGRGWAFVDLRLPTKREWGYAVVGTVASVLFVVGFGIVVRLLDFPSAPNRVVEIVGDDTTLLLAMFVVVFVANAPAEEFLFRNVIQKRLYDAFSRGGAIVVASLIFAVVHVPSFFTADAGAAAAAVSLAGVFGGSLVFGYVYARTENLVVPTVAHAGFNAFQFGLMYLRLEYGGSEGVEAALVLLAT